MKTKRITQVNRLRIVPPIYRGSPYKVVAPDGRILEEFCQKADALKWAKRTTDFIVAAQAKEGNPT